MVLKEKPGKNDYTIIQENEATLVFYRSISIAAGFTYNTITLVTDPEKMANGIIFLNGMLLMLYAVCYGVMGCMAIPSYDDDGELVDPGVDLNMDEGVAEHVKDIVILSAITHLSAIVSNYFWFLLLLIPIRGVYLLWVNFVEPWFIITSQEITIELRKQKRLSKKIPRYPGCNPKARNKI